VWVGSGGFVEGKKNPPSFLMRDLGFVMDYTLTRVIHIVGIVLKGNGSLEIASH
jgi:hypothetical protein